MESDNEKKKPYNWIDISTFIASVINIIAVILIAVLGYLFIGQHEAKLFNITSELNKTITSLKIIELSSILAPNADVQTEIKQYSNISLTIENTGNSPFFIKNSEIYILTKDPDDDPNFESALIKDQDYTIVKKHIFKGKLTKKSKQSYNYTVNTNPEITQTHTLTCRYNHQYRN